MAAVFTVRQVQFLSSLLLCLFQVSCDTSFADTGRQSSYNAAFLQLENRNGVIYREGQVFSGIVYQLDAASGDTMQLAGYRNGREHGTWKRFYAQEQVEEVRYFDNGIKTGTLTRWWPSGRRQFQCCFRRGEYDGLLQEWNERGQLIREMHYLDGHEEGPQKMFYDNGKVRSNYIVRDGKRTGLLGTKNCVNVSERIPQP
ncbi:MAG TPA: hypothetical protein VL092_11340 [Chitinophagaceae bacterium]|nr:hypothetical protein [Chitinophagaceae bacterium]